MINCLNEKLFVSVLMSHLTVALVAEMLLMKMQMRTWCEVTLWAPRRMAQPPTCHRSQSTVSIVTATAKVVMFSVMVLKLRRLWTVWQETISTLNTW